VKYNAGLRTFDGFRAQLKQPKTNMRFGTLDVRCLWKAHSLTSGCEGMDCPPLTGFHEHHNEIVDILAI
jgi:hypothetical protein